MRERKEGKDRNQRDRDEEETDNPAMTATTKKLNHKPAETAKSTGQKRPIRDSIVQHTSSQLTPVKRSTVRPLQAPHIEQQKYSQNKIIEEIKQAETELNQRLNSGEPPTVDDSDSDRY